MTAAELKVILDETVGAAELRPEYSPDGTLLKTFCNLGARRQAQACGCSELDDRELTADLMFALMMANASGKWAVVDRPGAVKHALGGGLAFAAMTGKMLGEAHGHIAAVRPELMRMSASAGGDVPMLANIGRGDPSAPLVPLRGTLWTRSNWNCRESEAFPVKRVGPATYIAWRS